MLGRVLPESPPKQARPTMLVLPTTKGPSRDCVRRTSGGYRAANARVDDQTKGRQVAQTSVPCSRVYRSNSRLVSPASIFEGWELQVR